MQFSDEILNKFVGVEVVAFTSCDAPDLTPEFPDVSGWMSQHFLNNVLVNFKAPLKYHVANFIHRTGIALRRYAEARELSFKYLNAANANPGVAFASAYFDAMEAWEAVVLNMQIAIDIWAHMGLGPKAFEKKDPNGPNAEARLYDIGNRVKHAGDDIANEDFRANATLALWCDNDGLCTRSYHVTYVELGQMLREMGTIADAMLDPRSFAVKHNWQLPT